MFVAIGLLYAAHRVAVTRETVEKRSEDLGAVRAKLGELAAEGRIDDLVALVMELLARYRNDNASLAFRLTNALRMLYGRSSEKVSAAQLSLMFDALDQTAPEGARQIVDQAAAAAEPEQEPATAPPQRPRKRGGRRPLPANLPRVSSPVPVADEERPCPSCGTPRKTMGWISSEILEFVPAQLIVIDERREKVACPKCEAHVSAAPSEKVMDGGRPGPRLLASIIVSKLDDSLPLYRQSKISARGAVHIPDSTLGDWYAFGTDVMAPIAEVIGQVALESFMMNTDDTELRVLDKKHPKGSKRGRMWAFLGDRKWAAFRYAPNWSAEHPGEFLLGYPGYVQGDGYAGYGSTVGPPGKQHVVVIPERRLGCGMHVRRPFEAAAKAGDARGAVALAYFRKLYDVERACKAEELEPGARLVRRCEYSVPVLKELRAWIDALHPALVPGEPLHKATTYARNQWVYFERCFTDGRFEIDNGLAERGLRLVVLGERNYLFAGSEAGARRLAVGYTIVSTCRLQNVDPQAYLGDVIELLQNGWPQARLRELLPDEWQRTRAADAKARTDALLRAAKLPPTAP